MTFIRLFTGISIFLSLSLLSNLHAQNIFPPLGAVGVNTTTPFYQLEVNGAVALGGSGFNLDQNGSNSDLTHLQGTARVLIGWNRSGGNGETDFITNTLSNLPGGFSFWNYSSSGVTTNLMNVFANGNVGIGTNNSDFGYKLAVNGNAIFNKIIVKPYPWADYVFRKDYHLPSLDSVAKYIETNNHLPGMPSTDSVAKAGIDVGANQALLLKKIEELTLYVIEQKKELDELRRQVADSRRHRSQ